MSAKIELTVSQLNEYVRTMFQMDPMLRAIELKGEVSNLKFHQSGALFFTMKDEQAAISCVMYASDVENLQAMPFEGMRAIAVGSVALYARGGQYQFVVKELHTQGIGVLYERLQLLKEKLGRQGLFDSNRKKAIPVYPDTIGVVSSPTGAVIHDILNVSLRRDSCVKILLCPVRVQGIGADDEVARAIELLDQLAHVSVIIVARGGGSMEDLWTFNEERVVRAVASCSKPIISAVGHETDVTLCDLAADLRVPTPSAAAECAVPLREGTIALLESAKEEFLETARWCIQEKRHQLTLLQTTLTANRPDRRIEKQKLQLENAKKAFYQAIKKKLEERGRLLEHQKMAMKLLSPYAVLERGYAIVQMAGRAVHASALHIGDSITLRFMDGTVDASITREAKDDGSQKENTNL